MSADTTMVETNARRPTDDSLFRVWGARAHANHEEGRAGCQWTEDEDYYSNRMRSVNKKVMAVALAGDRRREQRRVERYRELLSLTQDYASCEGSVGGDKVSS